MGKGNWERRAERENERREAARVKKAARGNAKQISTESIARHLLTNPKYELRDAIIKAWVEVPEKMVCRQWLRENDCRTKRCHFSHDVTIAHLRNVAASPHSDPSEPYVVPLLLRDTPPNQYNNVKFVSVDNTLVYDWCCADLWPTWSQARLHDIQEKNTLHTLQEEDNQSNATTEVTSGVTTLSIQHCNLFSELSAHIFSHIFSFSRLADICAFACVSNHIRHMIRKDDSIHHRRRQYQAEHAREIVKRKKEEKKKKIKSAYLKKSDKKDGFARGGNS